MVVIFRRNKSMKLAHGFDSMDDSGRGSLTRRGLWRFLRALLCGILTLCGEEVTDISPEKIYQIVDDAALYVSDSMLSFSKPRTFVTFQDFAEWYGVIGYEISPWLELIDRSKWKFFACTE